MRIAIGTRASTVRRNSTLGTGAIVGQTSANFTVTTFPVSNTTVVTITAFWGSGVETADVAVTKP
jgi:hypothetical protein